jgi:uncharacterized protein
MEEAAPMNDAADERLERLRAVLRDMGSVLVCYSGGVDSAFVLAVAHEVLGPRAVGMTAVSPSLAPFEKEAAVAVAAQIGARLELAQSHEIERPGYVANATDRCFHCKTELYEIAAEKKQLWGLAHVLNGTNVDDLGDYRPGLEAAKNAGVRSVLVELAFSKEDVRRCAHLIGLTVWDKPASACLSSRIPYGTEVTRERLAQIGGLEAELRSSGSGSSACGGTPRGRAGRWPGSRWRGKSSRGPSRCATPSSLRASASASRSSRSTSRATARAATTKSSSASRCASSDS